MANNVAPWPGVLSKPISANGQQLVPVSGVRESNISTGRIGRALGNFAKKVGPIAVGFAIADAVCDLADICNIDDVWQKTADPDFAGYPQQTGFISYYVAGFSPDFPIKELVCAFAADFYSTSVTYNSELIDVKVQEYRSLYHKWEHAQLITHSQVINVLLIFKQ